MDEMTNSICPVCNSASTRLWSAARDYEYFTSSGSYNYYQCSDCHSLFINPIPDHELDIIYPDNYYSFTSDKKGWAFVIKEWLDQRYFKKILNDIPGEAINILDAGGGTGWLLDHLKKTDKRINITQVADINEQAGNIARQKGHLYFKGRIEDFRSETKYHLVLLLNLIEHVSDPLSVLNNISGCLHPDGVILIKTPNTESADAVLFRRTYWGGLHCPRHWIIFSEKSFNLLLSKTSLVLKNLKYTQGGPFWAFSIIVALSRKGLLKTNRERPVIFHPLFSPVSAFFAVVDFIRRPFSKTSQLFIVLKKK